MEPHEEWKAEKEIELLARELLLCPDCSSVPNAFVLAEAFYKERDERMAPIEALEAKEEQEG